MVTAMVTDTAMVMATVTGMKRKNQNNFRYVDLDYTEEKYSLYHIA